MSHNTWIHKIVRVGVRPLVDTPVTPNHLTTLRIATGLAATAAYAAGTAEWRAWGGVIFVLSMLLDRADGELARLGGKTSPWGHKYDLIADAFCNAIILVGVGLGIRDGAFGLWAPAMGAIAGVAIAAILLLILGVERLEGEGAGEIGGAAGFDPDDAMLAVPVIMWMGWVEALIVAASIGAPGFALFLYLKFRRRLRPAKT
jgi:phosphatidylglycerophosphate synthase